MLYTIFASLPLLLVLIRLRIGSLVFFSMETPNFRSIRYLKNIIFSVIFTLAFLVKMPLYLFHLWLPKAHVEAPVTGSIILAAVLLKLGGYALFRVMWAILYFNFWVTLLLWVSCLGILVVGIICVKLNDIKSLIAYSSVSHISMALLGIYTLFKTGTLGTLLLLLRHGICSSGIFYWIGVTFNITKSRRITLNKGNFNIIKMYTFLIFILFIPNMAVPLTINLFSEIYILLNFISYSLFGLVFIVLGIFLVAYFTVILFRFVCQGIPYSLRFFKFNLKFDTLLVGLIHIFILNISFLFIRIFCLFILLKIKVCGTLENI